MIELYEPKARKSYEELSTTFHNIFIKYAKAEEDEPANLKNGSDFTSFPWNVYNEHFVVNEETKIQAQTDANNLCLLYRDILIYERDGSFQHTEAQAEIAKINQILDRIKEKFPEIVINNSLKEI